MKTSIILSLTSVLLGTLAGLGFQYLNRDTQQEVHLTQLHSEESKPTVLITPAPKLVVETDETLEKIRNKQNTKMECIFSKYKRLVKLLYHDRS